MNYHVKILKNNLNHIGKGLKCIDNVFLAQFAKQDWVFSFEVWKLIFVFPFCAFLPASHGCLGDSDSFGKCLKSNFTSLRWFGWHSHLAGLSESILFTMGTGLLRPTEAQISHCLNSHRALISTAHCYRKDEHIRTLLSPAASRIVKSANRGTFWEDISTHTSLHSLPNLFQCLNGMSQ